MGFKIMSLRCIFQICQQKNSQQEKQTIQSLNNVKYHHLLMKNIVVKHKTAIFAPVFHGIRFKVKRLFVVRTSNFFLYIFQMCLISRQLNKTE